MLSLRKFFTGNSLLPLLLGGMVALFLLSLCAGAVWLSPAALLRALGEPQANRTTVQILLTLRLPRLLACMLCGGALAVAGLLVQTLFGNPLASPNTIGVNSGAGFAAALALLLLPDRPAAVPAAAFVGALFAAALIYALSVKTGGRKSVILLAGIAVGSILSAGISLIHSLWQNVLLEYNSFLLGSFSGMRWDRLFPAGVLILAGLTAAFLCRHEMTVFALGDETAAALGQNIRALRIFLILTASVLAGASVSICGMLGFVGLLVPHLARRLSGMQNRAQVVLCALLGASLVLLCDLFSRVLFAPYELQAGILLSFLGGPFFLYLILKKRGRQSA
ncbi:MAG: iron ABC transporter permease [Oscillospiraceae bacterium]|jgi:iron complex transport system permease protein|nr:iron ABC transporter permease [Oscillospiraceae bacterium]